MALLFIFSFACAAWAENGYVRLAIKGTNVNLRPQPRAAGAAIAQMNTGDVFVAEKNPIVLADDKTEWYKIVLAVDAKTDKISILSNWDSRFAYNVAFIRADFAVVSPLEKGDAEKILSTPVGAGYSFNVEPHWGEFSAITENNFRLFSYWCEISEDTEIFDQNPNYDEDAAEVIGRYKSGDAVRLLGRDSEETYYVVMDPTFRQPVGYVYWEAIKKERDEPEGRLDFNAFNALCQRYVGANIGEIVRKWGDFKVERRAESYLDMYHIFSSASTPDMQLKFFEHLPQPYGQTPLLAIAYLQELYFSRKGEGMGGIYIGVDWCGKDWVKNLLGEPDVMDEGDAVSEYWAWRSEFADVVVRFEDGMVLSVMLETRSPD